MALKYLYRFLAKIGPLISCCMPYTNGLFLYTTYRISFDVLSQILYLLPTGSEERGVFGVGSIPVALLPSCQDMKLLHCHSINMNIVGQ